jgi:hypothetical protein
MGEEKREEGKKRSSLVPGLILIILGLAFLVLQFVERPWGPGFIFALVGLIFVVSAPITRNLGLYIPGFILLGLGTGLAGMTLLPPEEKNWPLILISLGLGFLAIWPTLTMPQRQHPWPLYPGGILAGLGLLFWMAEYGFLGLTMESLSSILRWWPLILVVIGATIIYRWYREREEGG